MAQIIVVRDLCQSRIILIRLYSRLCISVRNLLRPRVIDQGAVCIKLRQVLNLRCPIVSIIQCNFRSVTERYLQIGRTFSRGIVLIIPNLLNRDRYLLHSQIVFVGNDCKCRISRILRISCHRITGRESRLCPRVFDQISISILRKILNLCCPIVFFLQDHFSSVTECYLKFSWTFSSSIILIIPNLADSCRSNFRHMCIRKGRCRCLTGRLRRSFRCITRYTRLRPRVGNQSASFILRKIPHCFGPAISFIQCYCPERRTIFKKGDFETCRTDSILIIAVYPNLLYCKINCLSRCIRIVDTNLILLALHNCFIGITVNIIETITGRSICRIDCFRNSIGDTSRDLA